MIATLDVWNSERKQQGETPQEGPSNRNLPTRTG